MRGFREIAGAITVILMVSFTSCDMSITNKNRLGADKQDAPPVEIQMEEGDYLQYENIGDKMEQGELKEMMAVILRWKIEDVKKVIGDPDKFITQEDFEYAVYRDEGVMLGYDPEVGDIKVIKPLEYAYGQYLGFKYKVTVEEVESVLGKAELSVDYTESVGRFYLEYDIEGCKVRVLFYNGHVGEVLITEGNSSSEKAEILEKSLEKKDLVTGEVLSEDGYVKMLNHEIEYIVKRLGDYQENSMVDEAFKGKYSYNFKEEGVIFSGDENQKIITEVTFYNRGVFGIEKGMSEGEANVILGEQVEMKKLEHGLYKATYRVPKEDMDLFLDVYFDDKDGGVIYSTVRLNIGDGAAMNFF